MGSRTGLHLLLLAFLLTLAAGCMRPEADSAPAAGTAVTTTPPAATPAAADIRLAYPPTIPAGDRFVVMATNDSTTPYLFIAAHPAAGCLAVTTAAGEYLPTFPLDTCDALVEIVLPPGATVLVGSWNTHIYLDEDCRQQAPAAGGEYRFSVSFTALQGAEQIHCPRFDFWESFMIGAHGP